LMIACFPPTPLASHLLSFLAPLPTHTAFVFEVYSSPCIYEINHFIYIYFVTSIHPSLSRLSSLRKSIHRFHIHHFDHSSFLHIEIQTRLFYVLQRRLYVMNCLHTLTDKHWTSLAYRLSICRFLSFILLRFGITPNADRCNSQRNSVRLSVYPSVTFRCFVQANENTIVRSSASGGTIILVSEEVKFIRIFAWDHS